MGAIGVSLWFSEEVDWDLSFVVANGIGCLDGSEASIAGHSPSEELVLFMGRGKSCVVREKAGDVLGQLIDGDCDDTGDRIELGHDVGDGSPLDDEIGSKNLSIEGLRLRMDDEGIDSLSDGDGRFRWATIGGRRFLALEENISILAEGNEFVGRLQIWVVYGHSWSVSTARIRILLWSHGARARSHNNGQDEWLIS